MTMLPDPKRMDGAGLGVFTARRKSTTSVQNLLLELVGRSNTQSEPEIRHRAKALRDIFAMYKEKRCATEV